jgi:hypothetical protein
MKRTLILADALSSFAAAQTQTRTLGPGDSAEPNYVHDPWPSPSLVSQVNVQASQTSASSALTCSYRVTNGSSKPIFLFDVGEHPTAAHQLPSPPLHWGQPNPGATPPGWFETLGSARGGYSMGWQARKPKDLIQPGGSAEFRFDLPSSTAFDCGAASWRVSFATVYPVLPFPPANLSISLASLKVTPTEVATPTKVTLIKLLEGDVTIRNSGPNEAILNLGSTLGNGRSYPDRLFLAGRGPDGKDYELRPFGLMGVMGGRIFVMVVRIPSQGAYTVHHQWWLDPQAPSGNYSLHAVFEGVPGRGDDGPTRGDVPDAENVNILPYWLGKLTSNDVTLPVQ